VTGLVVQAPSFAARPGLAEAPAPPPVRRARPLLGTYVEITGDRIAAVEAGFAAIAAIQRLMSAQQPESDLSTLNRLGASRPVLVHPWTAAVIQRALHWAEASDGAFDPTVGGRMQAAGLLPRHPGQPAPDPDASWRDVVLEGRRAWLVRPCVIDLDGIAKGFAVDKAVTAMAMAGAERGLVNAGGDLRGFGPDAWAVSVAEPLSRRPAAQLWIVNAAVATSAVMPGAGGAGRLPGRSPEVLSATVAAPSAMDADALTKVVLADPPRLRACLRKGGARAYRHGPAGWEAIP
jgi:thiamine biosynthesis lipoprotein